MTRETPFNATPAWARERMSNMIAQGLLVEGPNGEDYLLTTEPHLGMERHRLVVRKKLNGQWTHMDSVQESACRESLIGAFVEFFVDLCRVLNSQEPRPAAEIVPIRPSPVRRARSTQPRMASRAVTDQYDH